MADSSSHSDAVNPERASGGLVNLLGIELPVRTAERVVGTMPVTPDHHQPLGYLHGGASLVLAETVASVGAFLAAPEGHIAFGMEINANHVRAKRSGQLVAEGVPLHLGRTSQVWDVKIHDEAGHLVCISRCTVAVVKERPPRSR
ncbi:MAG: hotdog fold thioesterase [Bacteroidota bacterium]